MASSAAPHKRTIFFVGLALALTATLIFAFSRTFFLQPIFQARPLNLPLIVHGTLGTCWFGLLVWQARLASSGKVAEHRKLGRWAPRLVVAIVASTAWVILTSLRLPMTGSGLPRHVGLLIQLSTTFWFVGLFSFAWVNRNRQQVHKRAMILATITMMAPAFSRISQLFRDGGPPLFDSAFLATFFIGALAIYDIRSMKRVHPVTLWVGLAYLAWAAVRMPIGKSKAWEAIAVPLIGG